MMTSTIRLARRHGKNHWVQLGQTWCGKPVSPIYDAHRVRLRKDKDVADAIASGKWCRTCAAAWWMAVGSREDSDCGYRHSPVPEREGG